MPLAKILGAGIGLASEAIHHSRAKKSAARERSSEDSSHDSIPASMPRSGTDSTGSTDAYAHAPMQTTAGPSAAYPSAEEEKSRLGEAAAGELVGIYDDEAIWELDDMVEYADPPAYSEADGAVADGADTDTNAGPAETTPEPTPEEATEKAARLVRELVRLAGPAPVPGQRLPCPVIIPQRRPRDKSRGFVRAYAPVLGPCAGIQQDVFLRFLKDWHQASKASAWIDVVYIAAGIAGFVPEPGTQIASIVVQVVAGTARELQTRHRHNTFLDRANQELFMPRGLFAMVMAFKDEVPGGGGGGLIGGIKGVFTKSVASASAHENAVKYSQMTALATAAGAPRFRLSSLRAASGATHAEVELPEAADLVYPDLDCSSSSSSGSGSGKFVQDYLDRRAQAAYESEHRGSSTAVPADARRPFVSRYADPGHAANSGSLVALLTGGAIVPPPKMSAKDRIMGRQIEQDGQRTGRRQKQKGLIGTGIGLVASGATLALEKSRQKSNVQGPLAPCEDSSPAVRSAPSVRSSPPVAPRPHGRKKLMQHDVLYLMIVNLPTDDEVAAATAQLDSMSRVSL